MADPMADKVKGKTHPEHKRDLKTIGHDAAEAGRNVWLASLGAVAEVETEARSLVGSLIERGKKFEERQKKTFERTVDETTERAKKLGTRLQKRAEAGVTTALERVGVPTRHDLALLNSRLETLSEHLDTLAAQR
jgi:poly(hydroxyalkanoate) granule-associated protein